MTDPDRTAPVSDQRGEAALQPVRRLIVMTRIPEAGGVKTRLIPVLGAEGAAALHEALLRKTLQTAERHSLQMSALVEVRYTGGTELSSAAFSASLPGTWRLQQGRNLGERMQLAIEAAFAEGQRQVVVIGTDCPDLSPDILQAAWRLLDRNDVVLGPATDGGYYLIGVNQPNERLFYGINWGTESVLRQTQKRCRELRVSVGLLNPLTDIDEAENLVICRRMAADFRACVPQEQPGLLSIIVPTLNEASQLEATVAALVPHPQCEVIIADGGSSDGTVELAQQLGCRVVNANRGRGSQMNAGAAMARGETLLFLHADSRLPETFQEELQHILQHGAIAGAFRFQIDQPGWALRCVEWGANLRARAWQLPYGDQGLFLKAADFFRVGGFQNWPLMEDYEICRRLRKYGRICIAASPMRTAGRRWLKLGVLQTTLINQICIAGFRLGVSPQRLAGWYAWSSREATDHSRGTILRRSLLAVSLLLLAVGWVYRSQFDVWAEPKMTHPQQVLAAMMEQNRQAFPAADEVNLSQLQAAIQEGNCVLVDVRTEAEREVSIIPGSISVAEYERTINQRPTDARVNQSVICYCTIGYRSADYAQAMKQRGISISSFNGSIVAWCQAGQKLVTLDGQETNRVHVYGPKWDLVPPEYVSVK